MINLEGLIAAVFTPFHEDYSLNLPQIDKLADFFIQQGVNGFYVCGGTGEGALLTREERIKVIERYVEAANGRVPVIASVGHESLAEARILAEQAAIAGADAMAIAPPMYYGFQSIDSLIDSLALVCDAAENLPLLYYHIPHVTGIDFDVLEFLKKAHKRLPGLVGMKFSVPKIFEFQECLEFDQRRFQILYGIDEMMMSAFCIGGVAAVGTSYNFASPIFRQIISYCQAGDLQTASKWQSRAVEMIRIIYRYGGMAAFKAVMKLVGQDCGPVRLPMAALTGEHISLLKKDLSEVGFFNWLENKSPKKIKSVLNETQQKGKVVDFGKV